MVRGKKRFGLLVDPGAANALMGTDTFREYYETVLKPQGLKISMELSQSTFAGIDGVPQPGQGIATFPIGLRGLPGTTFSTYLIAGEGSWCPGLLPLCMVRLYHMSLYTDIWPNGDGILVMFPNWTPKSILRPS